MLSWKFVSLVALSLAGVIILQGCSRSGNDHPQLFPVTGIVQLNGAPLAGARVQFLPSTGRSSAGMTDGNGKYALKYDANLSGAIAGDHRVSINLTEAVPGKMDDEGQPLTREVLPAEYNASSTLTAHVDSEHLSFDWNLSSPKSARQ